MKKSRKAPARVLAVLALIGSVVLLVAVVQGSMSDDSRSGENAAGKGSGNGAGKRNEGKPPEAEPKPASYVVQSGDTLSAIAEKTGVSVERIQALNPDVDPQILISGEKLKLR